MEQESAVRILLLARSIEQNHNLDDSLQKKIMRVRDRYLQRGGISTKSCCRLFQTLSQLEAQSKDELGNLEKLRVILEAHLENSRSQTNVINHPADEVENESRMIKAESEVISNGTLCAVFTKTDMANSSEDWILANVVGSHIEESVLFYKVVDAEIVDEASTPRKRRRQPDSWPNSPLTISSDKILAIPKSDEDALKNGEFGVKDKVLALFPGTTAFYEASIISNPSKRKKSLDYLVKFTDDSVSSRVCSPRFVLPLPQ